MKLQVTFEVEDDTTVTHPDSGDTVDLVDKDHPMGVTNEGYEYLVALLLTNVGADDVEVESVFEG